MPQPNFFSPNGHFAMPPAEQHIDLNEHLVRNKTATFFLRVHSNAMSAAGIGTGDVVIVDRMVTPQNGSVVIASLQGELIIRYYEAGNGQVRLVPASGQLSPILLSAVANCMIWGVVTYVIRQMEGGMEPVS